MFLPVLRRQSISFNAEQLQASVYHRGVVESAAIFLDFRKRSLNAEAWAIRAVRCHCLNGIRDGENSRFENLP